MSAQIYEFNGKTLAPIVSQGLAIGQRVRQERDYKIGVITGESGHGYEVTFLDGSKCGSQRVGSLSPFTRIAVVDGILSASEVEALRALAVQKLAADRAAQNQAANQHALDYARFVKELQAEFPWAKPGKASANLKKELTRAFPGVKFSVTGSRGSGSSLDITWTDGPNTSEVEAYSQKYAAGSFDGMTDCYDYDSSAYSEAVGNVLGQAKYVFENRHLSARFLMDVALDVCMEYGHDDLPKVTDSGWGAWVEPEGAANVPYCQGARQTLGEKIQKVAHEKSAFTAKS